MIAAVGGAVAAAIAGFIAAIVQLQMKRLRNGRRVKAGQPPYRDCVLIGWHKACPFVGAPASGVLAIWLGIPWAIAIGGLSAPGVIVILSMFLIFG